MLIAGYEECGKLRDQDFEAGRKDIDVYGQGAGGFAVHMDSDDNERSEVKLMGCWNPDGSDTVIGGIRGDAEAVIVGGAAPAQCCHCLVMNADVPDNTPHVCTACGRTFYASHS